MHELRINIVSRIFTEDFRSSYIKHLLDFRVLSSIIA